MTMAAGQPRRSRQPLGGRRGDWRHRLVHFHAPLAFTSALVLVLFMTLPLFDATGHTVDISSGAFPQQRAERRIGGDQHGGGPAGPTGGRTGHDNRSGPRDHPGDPTRSPDNGSEHGGREAEPRDPDPASSSRHDLGGIDTQQFTVATGYLALGLLALTLLIGPANLLLRRRNPISTYLARDVGTWAAVFSVVHVVFGLQVHGRLADFLGYFLRDGRPLVTSFGLGNWTGLAATVIVVGLLVTSSDVALRKLGARRWKRIQRLNYTLFALVIAHAFFYGALLRTTSPFTYLLLISLAAVVVVQAAGIWVWRRKHVTPSPRTDP